MSEKKRWRLSPRMRSVLRELGGAIFYFLVIAGMGYMLLVLGSLLIGD